MQIAVPAAHDLESIRRLLDACELPSADLTPAHLAAFLVVRDDTGELVGTVGLEPYGETALLRSLAVHVDARERGLGRRLVDAAECLARSRQVRTLYLLTTTAPAYFERRGFRPVERSAVPPAIRQTREFSSLCPATAATLFLSLEQAQDGTAAGSPP